MAETRRLTALSGRLESQVGSVPASAIATISGGADSAVAAWMVSRSGGQAAVHIDHGLPGSHQMRRAAEAIAARLGLELQVVTVEAEGDSEGALRRARYAALVAVGRDDQPLVLGHTADDQVETLVINLVRGSGVSGLSGMPRARGRLLRPLLGVWRSEIREMATLLGLPWRDDPSNQDLRHLRNRIRLDFIPTVERHFSTDFKSTLQRTADSIRDESEILAELSGSVPVDRSVVGFRIARGAARAAGRRRLALVLRRELAILRSGLPPERAVIEKTIDVLLGHRASAQLGDGIVARREGAFLMVGREPASVDLTPVPRALAPGSYAWGRFRFDVSMLERTPVIPLSSWAAVIPVNGSMTARVRSADADDAGAAKVARLPAGWPVVEVDRQRVWIPGVRRFRWENSQGDRYLCAVAEEESDWARYET